MLAVNPAAVAADQVTADPYRLAPPEHDAVYRTLMASRVAGKLCAILRAAQRAADWPEVLSAVVVQTHYKPFDRGRVVAEVVTQGSRSHTDRVARFLYLDIYSDPGRARKEHASAMGQFDQQRNDRPPLLLDNDWHAVGWWLPGGPNLEAIDFCFDQREYNQFLAEQGLAAVEGDAALPRLIRYVPRHRALFRGEPRKPGGPGFYIKCYEPGKDATAAANLTCLTAAYEQGRLAFRPPRMLFHNSERRAVGMGEVPGVMLTELMMGAHGDAFARVGCALASLHGSRFCRAPIWTPSGEMMALNRAMAHITQALPPLAEPIEALIEDIGRRASGLDFEGSATLHGNLFGDQILVDAEHIGIVDWDDLAVGDPLYDVGRLIAHMIYRAAAPGRGSPSDAVLPARAMLHSYQQKTGRKVDSSRLRWHIAVALLMRAKISGLRKLSTGWTGGVASAVSEARRILLNDSAWLPRRI